MLVGSRRSSVYDQKVTFFSCWDFGSNKGSLPRNFYACVRKTFSKHLSCGVQNGPLLAHTQCLVRYLTDPTGYPSPFERSIMCFAIFLKITCKIFFHLLKVFPTLSLWIKQQTGKRKDWNEKQNDLSEISKIGKTTSKYGVSALCFLMGLAQGWATCGPREHLIWPASGFSLVNLEYKIASKRSSMIRRSLVKRSHPSS